MKIFLHMRYYHARLTLPLQKDLGNTIAVTYYMSYLLKATVRYSLHDYRLHVFESYRCTWNIDRTASGKLIRRVRPFSSSSLAPNRIVRMHSSRCVDRRNISVLFFFFFFFSFFEAVLAVRRVFVIVLSLVFSRTSVRASKVILAVF